MGGFASSKTKPFRYEGSLRIGEVADKPFEAGQCRFAFRVFVRGTRDYIVVKVPKDGELGRDWIINSACFDATERYINFMRDDYASRGLTFASIRMAKRFNIEIDRGSQSTFLGIRYGEEKGLPRGYELWGEEFLIGFTKFNSNSGYVAEGFEFAQALSHYSWVKSNGQLVVCDLQGTKDGGNYVISDPAVHSYNHAYGSTDLGAVGMIKFMMEHRCNKWCERISTIRREFFQTVLQALEKAFRFNFRQLRGSTFSFQLNLSPGEYAAVGKIYIDAIQPIVKGMTLFK